MAGLCAYQHRLDAVFNEHTRCLFSAHIHAHLSRLGADVYGLLGYFCQPDVIRWFGHCNWHDGRWLGGDDGEYL